MNVFNPIDFTHDLESVGFKRDQAETLARGYQSAMQAHVTHEQLKTEMDRLFIRLSGAMAVMLTLAVAVLAIIFS